jgi:hypothetical protein
LNAANLWPELVAEVPELEERRSGARDSRCGAAALASVRTAAVERLYL